MNYSPTANFNFHWKHRLYDMVFWCWISGDGQSCLASGLTVCHYYDSSPHNCASSSLQHNLHAFSRMRCQQKTSPVEAQPTKVLQSGLKAKSLTILSFLFVFDDSLLLPEHNVVRTCCFASKSCRSQQYTSSSLFPTARTELYLSMKKANRTK